MTKPTAQHNPRVKPPRRPRREIMWTGLLAWPAAITVYILHTLNIAIGDLRTFDFTSIWCVTTGCIALHAAALHGPRRWFSARVLTLMSAAAGGCALLATVMVAVGRIDPTPSDLLVGLCLLLAPAVVGINAADALGARAAATASTAVDDQHLAAALETLETLSPTQAAECIRALQALHAARDVRPAPLRAVHTWDSMNGSGAHKS